MMKKFHLLQKKLIDFIFSLFVSKSNYDKYDGHLSGAECKQYPKDHYWLTYESETHSKRKLNSFGAILTFEEITILTHSQLWCVFESKEEKKLVIVQWQL